MATNEAGETLDRILAELQSNDQARCLGALEELRGLKFSSPAILRELEKLTIYHSNEEVRKSAAQALGTSSHQFVRRSMNRLKRGDRAFLLKQIEGWVADGLLPPEIAAVIRSRYDFDMVTPPAAPQAGRALEKVAASPDPPRPAVSAGPRPGLTETLLSEASIKVYLYLGAFFVIAAALILGALVEAARLPILVAATLAFGGAALILRKRLPQPGFALFIVFSFLLPIDANVFEETLSLRGPSLSLYWTLVFLIMAAIWSLSVWLYESRFFSAVAFAALSLAFYRAGEIFNAGTEVHIFLGILASFAGLAGTYILRTWKDDKFSRFIFLLAQAQVLGLLVTSFGLALFNSFGESANGSWPLTSLIWLAAAFFFVVSDLIRPFVIFPWLAVGALLPFPWFLLNSFDARQPAYALGFLVWGALLAAAGETAWRLPSERTKQYYWPLLAGSLPLFLTAFAIALDWDAPGLTFALLALAALVYGGLHLVHPRWYVWSAALLSALFAFFMLFQIPVIERLHVPLVYRFLMGSILLVIPELFARSPLSLKSESRWPALILGVLVSMAGILLALIDLDHPGRGALALIVYAVLLTLHAFQSGRPWLVYFAAACEALALVYALNHFNLDLWLPALTALAVLYYAAGFFFRRRGEELKAWGEVLVNSGLALGVLLSLASVALSKETGGWYVLIIALSFALEVFARPFTWLELAVETLLSLSLFLILKDFSDTSTNRFGHFLFGASLIWLGGDLVFGRLIKEKRLHRPITLGAGYTLVAMATLVLWGDSSPGAPAVYFSLYALFFALYAFLQREPILGYFVAAFLPLAVLKFCDLLNFEKWTFPLIALAVSYYLAGSWLRRNLKANGWDEMLIYSGLGLGALTSFAAPLQSGLDASISVAIAATLFAAEAFALRNVWWALPADLLYMMSYFMILGELQVDEPQFYSIGAALLGMLMHYLLTRAGSQMGAFLAGMLSQLVLLGTTYIQMVSTERLSFFFVLFIQSMVVLVYGLIQRSRSLVITPMAFAVIGVMTVVYSALKGLGPVILIGSTGVLLLMAGIVAVLMRERITRLGEQLSDWGP